MNKPVSQVYQEVIEFFQDKSRFAQGYYQYDINGKKCGWADAHSYCVLGALSFFTDGNQHIATYLLQRVSEFLYGKSIQQVNDGEDGWLLVMKALDFAAIYWKNKIPTDEDLGKAIVAP